MANLINWVTNIIYKDKTKVFPIEDINDENLLTENKQENLTNAENPTNLANNPNNPNKNIDNIIEGINNLSIKPKRNVKFDEKKTIIK
jgi:hypothetical protein